MLKHYSLFSLLIFTTLMVSSQTLTNRGKEFWVGYGHHQYMENGTNTQNMVLYLGGATTTATVTVSIDSSGAIPSLWYKKTYTIPAYTVIATENLPKGTLNATQSGSNPSYDVRLVTNVFPAGNSSEGLFRRVGIHIQSDVPIMAYAHIYGSVASGATTLLPVDVWGYEYTSINSEQIDAAGPAFSWIYVVAKDDSTVVQITLSDSSRRGKAPGTPYTINLQKGQIYQVLAKGDATGNGANFTGSTIKSLPDGHGVIHRIAAFAGSSRTRGESVPCGSSSGRDNDIQQMFPVSTWGTQYLTMPFSSASSSLLPSTFQTSVYKIIVSDPTTVVRRNGVVLTSTIPSGYYKYSSNTADYIEADKPIMIAQFMSGSPTCNPGGYGDPEMVYLSPLDNRKNQSSFYTTTKENISYNYVTLAVPNGGLSSLRIDGNNIFSYTYAHPNRPGYTVVVKGWPSAQTTRLVTCDSAFVGITYGLGGAESYGYNLFGVDTVVVNYLKGYAFLDGNSDTVKQAGEPILSDGKLTVIHGADTTVTRSSGPFVAYMDKGTFVSSFATDRPYYNIHPAGHTSTFNTYGNIDTVYFAAQPIPNLRDLSISVIPTSPARASVGTGHLVKCFNHGTDTAYNVEVTYITDTLFSYSVSTPQGSVSGDTIRWIIPMFPPQAQTSFNIFQYFSSHAMLGDTVHTSVSITTAPSELTPPDDTARMIQIVRASFDPNDKFESHGGRITTTQVTNGEYLQYTIRFQNTGNDNAANVVIKDTLDTQLMASTLQMVGASHDFQLTVTNGKYCTWSFNNINLPDSGSNEIDSHGYVSFIVKPRAYLAVGDTIRNRASIYFDYNAPIVTNVEKTAVVGFIAPLRLLTFTASKSGKQNLLQWSTAHEVNTDRFEIERSANGRDFITLGKVKAGATPYRFVDQEPLNGINYYRLRMIDKDGSFSYSSIRTVIVSTSFYVSVYPNPAINILQVQAVSDKRIPLNIQVISTEGKTLYSKDWQIEEGNSILTIPVHSLSKGTYNIKANAGTEQKVVRFEKL